MDNSKRKRLESKGWKVGTTAEFLNLSDDEEAYIEMKIALGNALARHRQEKQLTQEQLARLIKSSQSRVAKMEAADPSVSLDLLVRSLLALGTSKNHLAQVLAVQ